MKFVCSISINKPIKDVAKYFEDPEALRQSQKDFLRIEHLSGVKGTAGAKSKLIYKKFDLIETIFLNALPDEFYAEYEHKNMKNTMRAKFSGLSEQETYFTAEVEYLEFNGFFIKLMAKLFPSMFKKQVDNWLVKFKTYCENQ